MLSDQILLALITGFPAIIIAITGLIVVLKRQTAQTQTLEEHGAELKDIKDATNGNHADAMNRISQLENSIVNQDTPGEIPPSPDKPKGT